MVKKGNFNRAPLGCFFKIYRYRYTDLLIEAKFHFVSQHLSDDSDKFAGAMSEGIVVSPALCHLLIIVRFKGGIVFYYVVSCVDQSISENTGAAFRHPCPSGLKISGLAYRWIQAGKGQQLTGVGESMDITDFTKDDPAVDISDTRDRHDDRIMKFHDLSHLSFNLL